MLTLQDAVNDLYRLAITEQKSQSTKRLTVLADFCVQELTKRQISEVQTEISIPGIGRDKQWDVAWRHASRVRLGISLKSLLKNVSGTVPNRIDDLMGEMANVQLWSPEIVTGYIMVFNTDPQHNKLRAKDGTRWSEFFKSAIEQLSGRRAPAWATGMIEAAIMVEIDFSGGPKLISPPHLDAFFNRLADCVKERNPGAFHQ